MSYQIDFAAAVKSMFLPIDASFLLFLVPLAVILIGAYKAYQSRGTPAFRTNSLATCAVPLIFVVALLLLASHEVGAGWQLKNDVLTIKAPPVTATLELPSTSIALVSSFGAWKPVLRTNGTGAPGLSTGYFTLRNKKTAAVFSYHPTDQMMVLEDAGKYYVLAYPEIRNLYGLLIQRGAKSGIVSNTF